MFELRFHGVCVKLVLVVLAIEEDARQEQLQKTCKCCHLHSREMVKVRDVLVVLGMVCEVGDSG